MIDDDARARIDTAVTGNDVVLFMKGTPLFPQCGFSSRAIAILDHLAVQYASIDVLQDQGVRQGIKDYSDWPTIPQLYVKGEFVGGSDIMMEMYESGELGQLMQDKGVVAAAERMTNPREDRVVRLEPLVRRLLADNPSPFTFEGTQSYIVGRGEVAVIDPGPDLPEHVAAIVAATAGETIRAIVCTHTHRDHSPASRALQAVTGAAIVGCAPLTLEDEGPRADAAFDADYRPDRVLADGEALSGPGWTLRALATPGHTSNHLCFALEESGALFSGDHVMGWSTTVVSPPDGDMAAYMASLDRLIDRTDRIYYPGHGGPVTDPQRFVRGLAGHRRQREGQILRLLGEAAQPIPDMVRHMYRGIDPRLHGAAGRSVLAHLIDLETRERVVREGERWMLAA